MCSLSSMPVEVNEAQRFIRETETGEGATAGIQSKQMQKVRPRNTEFPLFHNSTLCIVSGKETNKWAGEMFLLRSPASPVEFLNFTPSTYKSDIQPQETVASEDVMLSSGL